MNSSNTFVRSLRSRRRYDRLHRGSAAALAVAALIGATPVASASTTSPDQSAEPDYTEAFDGPDGLVTNEFAFRKPDDPTAVISESWTVTSGSLFVRDGHGWSGSIDRNSPDPASAEATGSAVFRALPTVTIDGDTQVDVDVLPIALVDDQATDWDGFHVLVRVHSDQEFYSVSVLRRDGTIVIKRKDPGGPANGGTYTTLASGDLPMALGEWHHVKVETTDVTGAVRITLWVDEVPVLEAIDAGETGPPLVGPSGVGIRGDNLEFSIDDLTVTAS